MAKAAAEGARAAGAEVDLFQVAELLPKEVLEKMHAPAKPADVKVADAAFVASMPTYDGARGRARRRTRPASSPLPAFPPLCAAHLSSCVDTCAHRTRARIASLALSVCCR